jgi:hypothetical protein
MNGALDMGPSSKTHLAMTDFGTARICLCGLGLVLVYALLDGFVSMTSF